MCLFPQYLWFLEIGVWSHFLRSFFHFCLSGTFIRCLYSCYFPVSGQMTAFVCPVCIVTSSVVLFMCAQYSPFLCTMYLGDDVGSCLVGENVFVWLAIWFWYFSSLLMILYLCNSGTLHVLPPYGCGSGGRTSVSYGITWGSIWGCCLFRALGS